MAMTAQQFLSGYKLRKPESKDLCKCGQKLCGQEKLCEDCRYEELGKLIEEHPIVSPRRR